MSAQTDYWREIIANAAEECGASLTDEQLVHIAATAECAHENYGMALYSPPSSDRYNQIEREWQAKFKALEADFAGYRNRAESAVKEALRRPHDENVSIGKDGGVFRHGGRTERIL